MSLVNWAKGCLITLKDVKRCFRKQHFNTPEPSLCSSLNEYNNNHAEHPRVNHGRIYMPTLKYTLVWKHFSTECVHTSNIHAYEVCPEGMQPCSMKNRDIYWSNMVHRTVMPQFPSKWAPWDLTQFSQSPSAAPSHFLESHQKVWNIFPFKGDFSFGWKPEVAGCQI